MSFNVYIHTIHTLAAVGSCTLGTPAPLSSPSHHCARYQLSRSHGGGKSMFTAHLVSILSPPIARRPFPPPQGFSLPASAARKSPLLYPLTACPTYLLYLLHATPPQKKLRRAIFSTAVHLKLAGWSQGAVLPAVRIQKPNGQGGARARKKEGEIETRQTDPGARQHTCIYGYRKILHHHSQQRPLSHKARPWPRCESGCGKRKRKLLTIGLSKNVKDSSVLQARIEINTANCWSPMVKDARTSAKEKKEKKTPRFL